jgi:phospholipid/cholesterol/gamma-HCH transport system ATP-binding protein
LTGISVQTDGGMPARLAGLSEEDADVLRSLATLFIDVLGPFSVAMANYIHEREPRLGGPDDRAALEITRASCEGNMREIFSMLRAGLPPSANQTPRQAVEYALYQRRRGLGYDVVTRSYQYAVAMFRQVLALELPEHVSDTGRMQRIGAAADAFLFSYIATILARLLHDYGGVGKPWQPNASDEVLKDPSSAEAAKKFRSEQIAAHHWLAASPEQSTAHAESERALEEFAGMIEDAGSDPEISHRLSLAETTLEVILADETDLSVTLLFDRVPIEVQRGGGGDAESSMTVASYDLAQLFTKEFQLPMAIANGRVQPTGPVRKFLRVVPVLRPLAERYRARDGSGSVDELWEEEPTRIHEVDVHERQDADDPQNRGLLDEALSYDLHSGALRVNEAKPGDFWSVECIDVYKAFGRNRVLNGLNLGIPEGMISVILGPSGTGKSVLINHLIGLMFPDHGDILVHGKSVPNRRRSELFEMRRDFGILFQDGALFGSMNVYDNVAFPLREQTNKSEDEIRTIVNRRLEEVGLTAAATRMPAEISGGMKKRAGFARALVLEPKIVMFDEPDSGLDPVRTALLCDLIRKVHEENGGTYIVITHDIASARRLGEYIAVLWKGRIVESGDAEAMFNSPNPFVRQFLSGAAEGPLGME